MNNQKSNIQVNRFLVGSIIIYLCIAIASGDLVNASFLILASIVCTAGMSLIVWIPVCWLTGLVAIYLFDVFKTKSFFPHETSRKNIVSSNQSIAPKTVKVINHDVLAIATYIKKSRARQATDSQIANRLKLNGWGEQEIEVAFGYLSNVLD